MSFTASSGTHRRAASVEHNPADERDLENLLSQSSNSSNMETNSTLRRSIAQWATEYQEKHDAGDALLKILIGHGHSADTLLDTCESVEFQLKSGLQYIYLGCKDQLLKHLEMCPQQDALN